MPASSTRCVCVCEVEIVASLPLCLLPSQYAHLQEGQMIQAVQLLDACWELVQHVLQA